MEDSSFLIYYYLKKKNYLYNEEPRRGFVLGVLIQWCLSIQNILSDKHRKKHANIYTLRDERRNVVRNQNALEEDE